MRIEASVLRQPATTTGVAASDGTAGFGEVLGQLVDAVETSGAAANTAVARMVEGTGDVHDAMIAIQRADLMLQLTVQVRNKVVQAYQELSRMPV